MAGGRRPDRPAPSETSFADGFGEELGAAILDCLNRIPRGRPYAMSVRARFNALSKTKAGFAALEAAGLSVSARTILRWQAGTQKPSKRNAAIIDDAYRAHRRRPTPAVIARFRAAVGVVTGMLCVSDDCAVRTVRLDHAAVSADLEPLIAEWRRPDPDPEVIETAYVEGVIEPAFQATPEFPHGPYRYQLE